MTQGTQYYKVRPLWYNIIFQYSSCHIFIEAGSFVEAQFRLQSILNNERIIVSNYPHIFYYQINEKICLMCKNKRYHSPYGMDDDLLLEDFNILETTDIKTVSAVIIKD